MNSFNIREIPKLIVSILVVFLAGAVGTVYTLKQITTWYVSLIKPSWTPPNWAFGPIWSTLYVLMGISLFLVWREGLERKDVKIAILVFAVQLVINVLWSLVFFASHNIIGGLVMVIVLWISVLITILVFYRISKPAALILIPYLIWVTIAGYLNYTVFLLNP
ncbi:MAG: TspO/MBR family protein [Methanobacterium sp.]|uniref:TspO/MBR family protein n=1 Tax=Methanobacterium sp. TaxID=2164 RepID=UPI003C74FFFF